MPSSSGERSLRRLGLLLTILSAVAMLALTSAAVAAAAEPSPAELRALDADGIHELVIRRDSGLDARERRALRGAADATLVERLPLPDVEVLRVPAGALDDAAATLRDHPDVRWVEPNRRVRGSAADPAYLWAHANDGRAVGGTPGVIDADADIAPAWPVSTGAGITVAVVDTGIDAAHPDLDGRLAGNPGETGEGREGNGVDDDGNGLVDDARGWDWVAHDRDPDDENGHGTHVAGTIAATRDNGIGVAGGAPDAEVLALRVLDAAGSGWDSDVAAAFDYAGRLGIPVVNASLGGEGGSRIQQEAIRRHPGTLYVVAAGNDGRTIDGGEYAPCTIPEPNVICVGAGDHRDQVASYSNRGVQQVDLFAPGSRIVSTLNGGGYGAMSGTSMATPQVAAVAALVKASFPAADVAAVRRALLSGVDPVAAFSTVSATGGRLSATRALGVAGAVDPAPVPTPAPVAPPAPPAPAPEAQPTPVPTPAPPSAGPVAPARPPLVDAAASARRRVVTLQVRLRQDALVRVTLRATGALAARARRRGRAATTVTVTRRVRRGVSRIRLGGPVARGAYRITVAVGTGQLVRRVTVR